MEQEPCLKETESRTPRIVARTHKPKWIRMEGPDGGWAWVIAFSAFIISFIVAGLGRMSGIVYVAFIEYFGVDRQAASAPFSIRSSTRSLLGPVVGILGQKYGVRVVTISGGVLATVSAALCFFAPNIFWMTVLWGALNGIGAALTVTLPQVIVGQYFVKYTTTATGMAFSGGCIGSFVFPVLLEQLLLEYGVQGTFLILGAIIMHIIPAAMILRKPPWSKSGYKKQKNNNIEGTDCPCESSDLKDELLGSKDSHDNSERCIKPEDSHGKSKDKSGTKDFPDVQFLRQNNDVVLKILSMRTAMDSFLTVPSEVNQNESYPHREARIAKEVENMYNRLQNIQRKVRFYNILRTFKNNKKCNDALQKSDSKPLSQQKSQSFQFAITSEFDSCDVYKTCSVPDISRESKKPSPSYVLLKLKDLQDCHSDVSSRFPEEERDKVSQILMELQKLYDASVPLVCSASHASVAEYGRVAEKDGLSSDFPSINGSSNTFWYHIQTAVKLHRNPVFLLICLCRAVHFITFVPAMTTIVDYLMDKGFKEEDGKYAIAVLSLGDLLGRSCFGWVTDRNYLSLAKYMLAVMVFQGVSTASLPFMYSKTVLYLGLSGFGLLQGSLFVRHNVLVSKYMSDDEQSIAMGCMNFFAGILGLGLPAYIGYFRDTLGTYDYIYYINGSVNFLIGLLWALEPYCVSCISPKTAIAESATSV